MPGTTYEFAAWVINILNYVGNKPNITFRIETLGGIILNNPVYNTGDILETQTPTWKQYATTFTTTNNATIVLKMINNGPGGIGNDLALDDITFRPCGPVITPEIGATGTPTANMCAGETKNFNLSANVSSGSYVDPVYQWQVLSGANWTDIIGQTTTQITVPFNNAVIGVYKYRLLAAERQNINSASCRIASDPLIINVNAIPDAIATNSGSVCVGGNIQLTAPIGSGYSYEWTGPNSFSSFQQNPQIKNVTPANAGTYTVRVKSSGCTGIGSTQVQVLNPVIATTDIAGAILCKNRQIRINASGGTSYSWSPVDGLSDPNIANPIASPTQNTVYTVTVSNGACSSTTQVDIKIAKEVSANAGDNKKIIAGQSIALNGVVAGDNILRYYWTPADYLDDPNKLNPVATPPNDITYTLHAESNCGATTSNVFLKVYPKIEIPTIFSPNGDGKNDTWLIPAMDAFDKPSLKVVNRYGQIVFKSNGSTPWDGKHNGKDLPTGVYYYTLYLNNDFKTYSGWIFLIR